MTINLQRFCANEQDSRTYLKTPWKHGQWVYATNGHVCVRVPAKSMPDVAEREKAPPAGNLFDKHMKQDGAEFLLMPKLPKLKTCKACEGAGTVIAKKCPACEEGQFSHYGDTYDCQHCEGSDSGPGWLEFHGSPNAPGAVQRVCDNCDGLGADMHENGNFPLGESTYSLVYLSWLAALPQVRVCPGSSADKPTAEQIPAVFIFDGGQAILMPRSN